MLCDVEDFFTDVVISLSCFSDGVLKYSVDVSSMKVKWYILVLFIIFRQLANLLKLNNLLIRRGSANSQFFLVLVL